MIDGKRDYYEFICAICEKPFRYTGSSWLYKIKPTKGKLIRFCGWNCMRTYEKTHEKKKGIEKDVY